MWIGCLRGKFACEILEVGTVRLEIVGLRYRGIIWCSTTPTSALPKTCFLTLYHRSAHISNSPSYFYWAVTRRMALSFCDSLRSLACRARNSLGHLPIAVAPLNSLQRRGRISMCVMGSVSLVVRSSHSICDRLAADTTNPGIFCP
jgi:hypothetical protein